MEPVTAECPDHWHCDPTQAAHGCTDPDRSRPCPTCGERPIGHIRIVRTAQMGRGWCGGPGKRRPVENRTACGGEMTAYDSSPRDAARMLRDPRWRGRVCTACAATLTPEPRR